MTPSAKTRLVVRATAFLAGFLVLTGLSAAATLGWARHGERLWLAMADGAWATCF